MNGINDCGGMDGMGPLPADDGVQFHAEWERIIQGLIIGVGMLGQYHTGEFRGSVENLGNARLLNANYFERWLFALEHLVEKYRITEMEPPAGGPPLNAKNLSDLLYYEGYFHADVPLKPRFAVGDRIRSRNWHPRGHTRLPRYARDKLGVVVRRQGVFYSPEFLTREGQPMPQHVYSVRFSAKTLWGEAINDGDSVCMDLWEDHLVPLDEAPGSAA